MPESFGDATTLHPPSEAIDVSLARRQHEAYADTLRALGLQVTTLDAADELPDCPFVEDQAVARDGVALITRSGHAGRRAEASAVAAALARHLSVVRMEAPATCDGGDVLAMGGRLFVGVSERTNPAGIASVRLAFGPLGVTVTPVPVPAGTLHLKSVCSALSADTVVVAEGAVDPAVFDGLTVVRVPAEEAYAANVLAVDRRVIVSAGYPAAERAVASAGFEPIALDMSEFRKGDGALTCLSILY